MKKFLVLLSLMILLISCSKEDIFAPDIEAIKIEPLGYYIIDAVRAVPINTVTFVARNSVDAHIIGLTWEFYTSDSTLIYAAPEPFPMSVKVEGLVDPECVDTTYIYDIWIQTDTLSSYLINNDLMSAEIKYRFIVQADYSPEYYDTVDISLGIYRITVLYLVDIKAEPDSIPRDGYSSTKITATCQDFGGNPVIGASIQFSTTLGIINPTYSITNSSGEAFVFLTSDIGSALALAYATADHPYASWPVSVPVKFYPPGFCW